MRAGRDGSLTPDEPWRRSWELSIDAPYEPIAVGTFEIREPAPIAIEDVDGHRPMRARILVTLDRRPIGFVSVDVVGHELTPAALEAAILPLVAAGIPDRALTRPVASLEDLRGAVAPLEPGPEGGRGLVSIVVPTHNRAESLSRLLDSLDRLHYRDVEVVVVDSAPSDDLARDLVHQRASGGTALRYVREPVAGSSRARNTGAAAALGPVIAFIDDDTVVSRWWLDAALDAFDAVPAAVGITGFVPSLRLDTAAQAMFDQGTRWNSRFERSVWTPSGGPSSGPAYPFTVGAIGASATLVVKADALREVGGFDEVLGAGTIAHGGEDLDLFVRLLLAGHTVVAEPSMIVWHDNRETERALRRQTWGWSVGLGAYIAKQATHPATRRQLWRRVPAGVRHARGLQRNAARLPSSPSNLALQVAGWCWGPCAYAISRRRVRRSR